MRCALPFSLRVQSSHPATTQSTSRGTRLFYSSLSNPRPRRCPAPPVRRRDNAEQNGASPPASRASSAHVTTRTRRISSRSPVWPASASPTTHPRNAADAAALSLPHLDVVHPPPDARSPPALDIVHDFKVAAARLLERFTQDNSLSARKRESWARIAPQLVNKTESERAAAVADAIVFAFGAEHADKLCEHPPLLSFGDFNLSALCLLAALLSHHPYPDLPYPHSTARLAKNGRFWLYIFELILTHEFFHVPSVFPKTRNSATNH